MVAYGANTIIHSESLISMAMIRPRIRMQTFYPAVASNFRPPNGSFS